MDTSRAIPETHPLHRLFRGLTEYAFMNELGIGDPSLVGYVAELLASFVPSQTLWQIRDSQGRYLSQVTAMIAEAESAADSTRRRECHRHVGDFTLFWTGVYPEALAKLQGPSKADALVNYQQQGKRSYHLASTLSGSSDQGYVLRRLSDQFELCASDCHVSGASGKSLKAKASRQGVKAGLWSYNLISRLLRFQASGAANRGNGSHAT